jgi:hypothetical protein
MLVNIPHMQHMGIKDLTVVNGTYWVFNHQWEMWMSMDIVGESLYLDYYNGLSAILDGISHEPDDEQRFTGEIATISGSFGVWFPFIPETKNNVQNQDTKQPPNSSQLRTQEPAPNLLKFLV